MIEVSVLDRGDGTVLVMGTARLNFAEVVTKTAFNGRLPVFNLPVFCTDAVLRNIQTQVAAELENKIRAALQAP